MAKVTVTETQIVIDAIPLPPSANKMYDPIAIKRKAKDGFGVRVGVGRMRSAELNHFKLQCMNLRNQNLAAFKKIHTQMLQWMMQGYTLRVDTYFVFHVERVWTKNRKPEQIDADNRRKPAQDSIADMIGLDDKWFFAGEIEKATCIKKESECSIIVIKPFKPRTLEQIRASLTTIADT